jgi:predicted ATPase
MAAIDLLSITDAKARPGGRSSILTPPVEAEPNRVSALDLGYRMIESFEIENFRSFRQLKLTGLPRINILVGQSAAGKTSLLEAIRLALGATPAVAWNLTAQRGALVGVTLNPTRDQFEAAWKPYFPEFDITKTIKFLVTSSDLQRASLKMYFDNERPVTPISPLMPGIPGLTNTIMPLAFERLTFSGEKSVLDATIHQQQHGQLFLQQGVELGIVSEFFPSTWLSNSQQAAQWLSQLRISNRGNDLVNIIGKQFPDITDLSSEIPYGMGAIYATVKHHAERMPISLISSGLNKFVSLLIAIRTYRNGVILIDEIENGIYYKMFSAFWEALHQFSVDNNTQLFISTHSLECLKGVSYLMKRHPEHFSIIQLIQEKGVSVAYTASGDKASAAIEQDIEVRR